jgi:hypothetical protein
MTERGLDSSRSEQGQLAGSCEHGMNLHIPESTGDSNYYVKNC